MKISNFALVSGLIFGSFIVLNIGAVQAADGNCGVPVCNVDKALEDLKFLDKPEIERKQAREQYVLKTFPALVQDFGKSQSAVVWNNLLEYSTRARELFVKLLDADFVLREADTLIDVSNLGLHKYGPLTLDNMLRTFKGLLGPGRRFEAIQFWENIDNRDSFDEITTILQFLAEAKKIANAHNDPDWLFREIDSVSAEASTRLSQLDPILEGPYNVTLKAIAPVGASCHWKANIDTLMIADSMTGDGVVAALIGESDTSAFFKNLVFVDVGSNSNTNSISIGVSSNLTLSIDRESGKLTGTYKSTRNSCTYEITGQRFRSPGEFMRDGELKSRPSLAEAVGVYDAIWGGVGDTDIQSQGTLILREYVQNNRYNIAASLLDPYPLIDFQYGYYVPNRAYMILNQSSGEYHIIRWNLAYRLDANGEYVWRGFGMSLITGRVYKVQLKRRGNLGADTVTSP